MKSLILQYVNLLHKHHSTDVAEVREFIQQHREDKTLMKRIKALNKMFKIKWESAA